MRGERGFTLIELMIVFVATGVIVGVVSACCALCAGNFWYSEQGVLRALQSDHPNITKVELIERHVYDYSIVVAKQGDQEMMFFLDSNMLFNYKFQRAEQFSMNSAVYRF
ncbi:MAG: prepilin-type N-terminal cleavage/methylation domain-containing protein [Patescibacteria group bacterium]